MMFPYVGHYRIDDPLKIRTSRGVVLHDDSFVEDYPVVFVLMYGK